MYAVGIHVHCLEVNLLMLLLSQIRPLEPQVLAMAPGNVMRKHVNYECMYEMVDTPILLTIKPVRFELMVIAG